MPYSGASDPSLPSYVKKLGTPQQRQWVAIFNSAYRICQRQGGGNCEESAFKQANGVVMGQEAAVALEREAIAREQREFIHWLLAGVPGD